MISFTSDFIPRLVYQYMYSPNGTMHGFIDHTLSYFNVSNFKAGTAPTNSNLKDISFCRYRRAAWVRVTRPGCRSKRPCVLL